MSIHEGSKKIIQYFLTKAIDCGELFKEFSFEYGDLTSAMDFSSKNYCQVCCQYLNKKGYISIRPCVDEFMKVHETITLQAEAVDFLECDS